MASFRSNGILLALVLVVAGVTACNSYVTQSNCQMYLEGNDYNINEMARNKMVADERIRTNELIRVVNILGEDNAKLRDANTRLATELLRALMPPQECPAEKSVLKDKDA